VLVLLLVRCAGQDSVTFGIKLNIELHRNRRKTGEWMDRSALLDAADRDDERERDRERHRRLWI
jgi:hypothetical protein